jgi:hypothetical protein
MTRWPTPSSTASPSGPRCSAWREGAIGRPTVAPRRRSRLCSWGLRAPASASTGVLTLRIVRARAPVCPPTRSGQIDAGAGHHVPAELWPYRSWRLQSGTKTRRRRCLLEDRDPDSGPAIRRGVPRRSRRAPSRAPPASSRPGARRGASGDRIGKVIQTYPAPGIFQRIRIRMCGRFGRESKNVLDK